MDLGAWLLSLGLEQYEATFRKNAIDEALLPSLTAEDLKDLGIDVVGHRRKLLNAIEALRVSFPASTVASEFVHTSPQDAAERRQVTVMFADLVGSTALSAHMDPEDMREIITAYHKCAAETVRRLGGFVAQYLGDGLLVYFGYPQAHEDDAERAVRAGLELVAAVSDLQTHAPLQTRVGIATGMVVVGDLTGSGQAREHGIVGETPNLSARLQRIAEPNMVVIDESTRKLLGNLFELQDLDAGTVKGIPRPVRAWAARRSRLVESRFEALHASVLPPMVGRAEEFELLLRRWSKAKGGEGQVVFLSGEPGIGKSRLTAALLQILATEQHTRLRYFCSPQRTDSVLYPIISQMERAAGFTHADTKQTKLDKLDALLAQTSTSIQNISLLAEMLSLPNDERYPVLEMTAQQRRQKTLEALRSQVEALTQANPVLMIFEDAHWADPTSLELLSSAMDRIASRRVLLIVTFRPEFEAPWIGRSHVTILTLNRLSQREVDLVIDGVAGTRDPILTSIRHDIIERSDGIPLFVEEMTKAVLEAGSEGKARRVASALPWPALSVPASLQASLMARLDRLGSAKEVAQVGAAIGREFSHALLGAVVQKPTTELGPALDCLTKAGLLLREGAPPHATYLFKHALVQDAAYGTLLREQRRALHARIADTLESGFEEIAEREPELLAHHNTEAGVIEKAAILWGKAGQRSLARSALIEAATQLSRALDQIAGLPSTPALRREQIRLQVALINSLMHVKGYAAPETKAAVETARLLIEKAEAVGEPPNDPLVLFSILYGFWGASYVAFNGCAARGLAEQFLALAEKDGATVPLLVGHRIMGSSLLLTGDIAGSQDHFDHALTLYDPVKHRELATRFGQDIGVSILMFRSCALWLLGYPEAAIADADRAVADARQIGHAASLMLALANLSHMLCGHYARAKTLVDELVALADDKSAVWWKALGMSEQGYLCSLTGEASSAVHLITSALAVWKSTGSTVFVPMALLHLASAYAEVGLLDDAWRCVGEAMTAIEVTEERWFEAAIHQKAGEIALMSHNPDSTKAAAHFERALDVARKQHAKSLELRATTSMARLWRDEGKVQQARQILDPIYRWFTEGFDTRDLKEAKALLNSLAS
jgi:class 3 adenylate cyclase/predicted ATPase/energy-coupling factor transporter ATP-binding protein EcfA2